MWSLLLTLVLCWGVTSSLLIWRYRHHLLDLWSEPVLRHPVLIIESDDWGAGPSQQASAMRALADHLSRFKDRAGHPPVMTLGVVLAIADTAAMAKSSDLQEYRRITLDETPLADVKNAMLEGVSLGVFALQLHGMEHYRPTSLLKAANNDPMVAQWLVGDPLPATEPLPSPLQSRWTDSSTLPSMELQDAEIETLVKQETTTFAAIFGHPARVVVPPTFQWTKAVERAWGREGVRIIISPGRRLVRRDANGALSTDGSHQYNGTQGPQGITYLIRDAWFEPSIGHRANKGLQAIEKHAALGRPTLLETHRFNFLGPDREDSLQELDTLLQQVLEQYPEVRFTSSEGLADHITQCDPKWVLREWRQRASMFLARLKQVPRLGRLARIGAFGIPLGLAQALVSP